MLEIAFVLAPRQNLFFVELQAALAAEIEAAGVQTSVHVGAYPPPRQGLVYVIMPPHEYFTLLDGRVGPPPDVHARTIFVSAEQPDTSFFEKNLHWAPLPGTLFDINHLAVEAYAARGIAAQHLQIGYTPSWDFFSGREGERDIDVLFMGAASDRRLRHLASYARTLRNRRCQWVISDNGRPNWQASGSFLVDEVKWDLLRRSKVLINLHQESTPYFEWLRVVQAMANGCTVVTESSLGHEPLVAGEHLLVGQPESLGHLAERLLSNHAAREHMQTLAYEYLRDQLPLAPAVGSLIEAARRLDAGPVPAETSAFFHQPPPSEDEVDARIAAMAAPPPPTDNGLRRVLKDVRLDLLDLRRRLDRAALPPGREDALRVEARTPGWWAAQPRVTVLVSLYNYARHIEGALDSLLASTERTWEVVIVDDGSTDDSLERAREWLLRHEGVPGVLLAHPVNRGLARARNAAIDFARGEYCFVLDADNEVMPRGLGTLVAALDGSGEDVAMAYGILERFTAHGSAGLSNVFPWQPWRFKEANYIDAMALMRTSVLRAFGGYRTDHRLHGWEDYDLWCRFAEAGLSGVHVPDVVARYRTTDHSMLSLTNISVVDAVSVIAEASPTVMDGAVAPY